MNKTLPLKATFKKFDKVRLEALRKNGGKTIFEMDDDAHVTRAERAIYHLENRLSVNPNFFMYVLMWATLFLSVVFAGLWMLSAKNEC